MVRVQKSRSERGDKIESRRWGNIKYFRRKTMQGLDKGCQENFNYRIGPENR